VAKLSLVPGVLVVPQILFVTHRVQQVFVVGAIQIFGGGRGFLAIDAICPRAGWCFGSVPSTTSATTAATSATTTRFLAGWRFVAGTFFSLVGFAQDFHPFFFKIQIHGSIRGHHGRDRAGTSPVGRTVTVAVHRPVTLFGTPTTPPTSAPTATTRSIVRARLSFAWLDIELRLGTGRGRRNLLQVDRVESLIHKRLRRHFERIQNWLLLALHGIPSRVNQRGTLRFARLHGRLPQ
jgi:hypothetical protein